jgi:hypothetical protein
VGDNASATLATTKAQCLQGCQCNVGKDVSATPAKLPALDWPDMKAKLLGNALVTATKNTNNNNELGDNATYADVSRLCHDRADASSRC